VPCSSIRTVSHDSTCSMALLFVVGLVGLVGVTGHQQRGDAHSSTGVNSRTVSSVLVRKFVLSATQDSFDTERDNGWVNQTVEMNPATTALVM
jgi:hypothetical protein